LFGIYYSKRQSCGLLNFPTADKGRYNPAMACCYHLEHVTRSAELARGQAHIGPKRTLYNKRKTHRLAEKSTYP
jgi:hypothetical protein